MALPVVRQQDAREGSGGRRRRPRRSRTSRARASPRSGTRVDRRQPRRRPRAAPTFRRSRWSMRHGVRARRRPRTVGRARASRSRSRSTRKSNASVGVVAQNSRARAGSRGSTNVVTSPRATRTVGQVNAYGVGELRWRQRTRPCRAHLLLQRQDPVHQHLGPRRAAGHVHVHRHDRVDALHDRVVGEHPAGRGAHAHRDDPLRFGHLVVDLPQDRRHLLRDAAGDDHQVGLARRGPEQLPSPTATCRSAAAPVDIISIAQQARPNVAGHIDCLRDQLTAGRGREQDPAPDVLLGLVGVVLTALPVGRREVVQPARTSPPPRVVASAGASDLDRRVPRIRGLPVEPTALPHVDVRDEHERDEDRPSRQPEQPELCGRPTAHGNRKIVSMSKMMNSIATT